MNFQWLKFKLIIKDLIIKLRHSMFPKQVIAGIAMLFNCFCRMHKIFRDRYNVNF